MKKHIVCFGDSNTHGMCTDPYDTVEQTDRYNEDERWTSLLQRNLGDDYVIYEEGLNGRTTVFEDPLTEGLSGLSVIYPVLLTHEPVELLIIMLGSNDCKERFSLTPTCIGLGLERLIQKAKTVPCWRDGAPNILVMCPAFMGEKLLDEEMGKGCIEKSKALPAIYKEVAKNNQCHFLDINPIELNRVDHLHLSKKGHLKIAEELSDLIPELLK